MVTTVAPGSFAAAAAPASSPEAADAAAVNLPAHRVMNSRVICAKAACQQQLRNLSDSQSVREHGSLHHSHCMCQ